MEKNKLTAIIIFLTVLSLALTFIGYMVAQVNANVVEVPVTQEQCAYPVRPLNPDGSCDNSDPCDPTRIKIDGGKCVDNASEPALNTDLTRVQEETGKPINRFSDPEVTECGK